MKQCEGPYGFYHLILICTYTQRRNKFLIANNDLQKLTKELTACPRICFPVNSTLVCIRRNNVILACDIINRPWDNVMQRILNIETDLSSRWPRIVYLVVGESQWLISTPREGKNSLRITQFILSHCNKRLETGYSSIIIVYICFKFRGFFKI